MLEETDHLICSINSFLAEARHLLTDKDRPRDDVEQHDDPALAQAAALLREALHAWQQERSAHQRTKLLLKQALADLNQGTQKYQPEPEPEGTSPQFRNALRTSLLPKGATPRFGEDLVGRNSAAEIPLGTLTSPSKHLHKLLSHAETSHTNPALTSSAGFRSPRSPTVRRPQGLSSEMTSPPRSKTPPFSHGTPRFRDMIPAGDGLVFASSHKSGLEYKTKDEAARMLSNSTVRRLGADISGGDLSASNLYAKQAIQKLKHRLSAPSEKIGNDSRQVEGWLGGLS